MLVALAAILALNPGVLWLGDVKSAPDDVSTKLRDYVALSANAERKGAREEAYGIERILRRTCTQRDTRALIQAIQKIGPSRYDSYELLSILAKKGEPKQTIAYFVGITEHSSTADRRLSLNYGLMLHEIERSRQKIAVDFLMAALRDPKADPSWRYAAFSHLAGTGGRRGLATVREMRSVPRSQRTWQAEVMSEFAQQESIIEKTTQGRRSYRQQVLANAADTTGRTWRLFRSAVFGERTDLFIQPRLGESWGKPIYLGVHSGEKFGTAIPTAIRGIPTQRVIDSEWMRLFTDDPAIRADSDHDGLTDLVELRLGSDPFHFDTDRDGVPDAIDPCPNAAPRNMGDREKIVAATVEAIAFNSTALGTWSISVPGVFPFELYGYQGRLVWNGGPGITPKVWLTGARLGHQPGDWVEMSADGKSARTYFCSSHARSVSGQEVFLKKFGNDWFVVDLGQTLISD